MSQKTRRILMSLFGVLICAVSVGIFKIAALGVDPFQSLMSGLDALIPIPFGTLYVIVNLVLLSFSLIVDRNNIGINNTAACIKHYLGYGVPVTGKDRTPAIIPDYELRERYILLFYQTSP